MKVLGSVLIFAAAVSPTAWAQDAGATGYGTVTADEVVALLTGPVPVRVVDVRLEAEYARAHIPGSVLSPWEKDAERFVATLPADKSVTLVLYCNGPT